MNRVASWLGPMVTYGLALATPVSALDVDSGQRPDAISIATDVRSPLLAIDRNRATVVERIVVQWGDALANAGTGISAEQLREMLLGMRADHLFAASLAGNLEG